MYIYTYIIIIMLHNKSLTDEQAYVIMIKCRFIVAYMCKRND